MKRPRKTVSRRLKASSHCENRIVSISWTHCAYRLYIVEKGNTAREQRKEKDAQIWFIYECEKSNDEACCLSKRKAKEKADSEAIAWFSFLFVPLYLGFPTCYFGAWVPLLELFGFWVLMVQQFSHFTGWNFWHTIGRQYGRLERPEAFEMKKWSSRRTSWTQLVRIQRKAAKPEKQRNELRNEETTKRGSDESGRTRKVDWKTRKGASGIEATTKRLQTTKANTVKRIP